MKSNHHEKRKSVSFLTREASDRAVACLASALAGTEVPVAPREAEPAPPAIFGANRAARRRWAAYVRRQGRRP